MSSNSEKDPGQLYKGFNLRKREKDPTRFSRTVYSASSETYLGTIYFTAQAIAAMDAGDVFIFLVPDETKPIFFFFKEFNGLRMLCTDADMAQISDLIEYQISRYSATVQASSAAE